MIYLYFYTDNICIRYVKYEEKMKMKTLVYFDDVIVLRNHSHY